MRPVLALLCVLALPACDALTLDDLMDSEAVSPDRQLVARAWCTDGCDVVEARTITIGQHGVPVTPRLPSDDVVERVSILVDDADGAAFAMRWTAPRALQISGECLSDGKYAPLQHRRWRGVSITFVRLPSVTPCPEPRT